MSDLISEVDFSVSLCKICFALEFKEGNKSEPT